MGSGSRIKESVWDYPRPPGLEPDTRHVRVEFAGETIASSSGAYRVLETSHPPSFYIPAGDVNFNFLAGSSKQSFCEWKGIAEYWSVNVGLQVVDNVGWSYPKPTKRYAAIKDYVSFYPSKMYSCFVGDEQVQAQEGEFYGGWITSEIEGPFKGGPGTWGW
ncbi:MAG: DUF427 domain-containing protein [Rhodospirillales bacterium]|jgi:uncharacterized protein (DUF427 family)